MTDKQVVWFMGFCSTSTFPKGIFFSTVTMIHLHPILLSNVICLLFSYTSLAKEGLNMYLENAYGVNDHFYPNENDNEMA